MSGLFKRSFTIAGHRTSIALEEDFWRALEDIAARDGVSLAGLVAAVDQERAQTGAEGGLASALRVHALRQVRN
jgi:predicted DNA-binding ribbon-helix-helix protein